MNLFWITGLAAFRSGGKDRGDGFMDWTDRRGWHHGIGALLFASMTLTMAAANDYRFELVGAPTGAPGTTTLTVRLVHAADNKAVEDATIVEAKTDMGPAGMAEMSGKVTPIASDQPEVHRFSIETGMAGKWGLVLTAKTPRETAPITGKVLYDAKWASGEPGA